MSICPVKGCGKTVRKRKKEHHVERNEMKHLTLMTEERETPQERPRNSRWMTKYAIWARVSVTIPFFVFCFSFFLFLLTQRATI